MKKITFIFLFLTTTLVFSQELITNGDFQTGPPASPWYSGGDNNPIEIVDQGGNFVFQANVQATTDTWRVNLSQVVALQDNTSYELSFDAFTDATTGSRPLNVSLGQAGPNFAGTTPVVAGLTDTPQTFNYTITTNFDTANSGSSTPGSRVIFDMGDAVGFVFIDNVSLQEVTSMNVPPTTAPPTPPARDAADVISIYGEAYGTAIGLNNVPWDDPTVFNEEMIAGNNVLKADLGVFLGSTLGSVVDGSEMTHFHMDFWVADEFAAGQVFNPKWSNHTGGAGETDAGELTIALGPGDVQTWVSIDVPLTDFNNVNGGGIANREALTEFLITTAGLATEAYIDNIYLHKNTTLNTSDLSLNQFKAYPNPTANTWNISSTSTITKVQVFDVLGKSVININPNNNATVIDATILPSGLYFARVEGDNGTKTIKLIKE